MQREAESVSFSPFPSQPQYILAFDESIDVMRSKARPKKIRCQTTRGKTFKFLCKREEKGDLRKDSRFMEFCAVVNRLLKHEIECSKRNLSLRTYAVICLNEECGLLEWVEGTECIKAQIDSSYRSAMLHR